ncbi:MAG: septal ring lytic transglycosylase RlpA family protein [bacterium]|jgi:rare lipoprotein A
MNKLITILTFAFCVIMSLMCAPCKAQEKKNYRNVPVVDTAVGYASFYSDKFIGKMTANGEKFSQDLLTCAHNTLPFGTKILVTNLSNQRSVVVRVNDRLHHRNPRLVDLTRAGAKKLGFNKAGVIKVRVEVVRADTVDVIPKPD